MVIVVALAAARWMTFDGMRALIVGDYVTPETGEYAGQLGPWAKIVSAFGIEPSSTFMKSIFVVYGVAWLILIGCFALGFGWAWWAMLVAAGTLWNLWTGTISGVVLIALLLLPVIRSP